VDCITCEEGYFPLEDNSKICKNGEINEYFKDTKEQKYLKCGENCQKCEGRNKCSKCNDSFYLNNNDGLCYNQCPEGFYNDEYKKICSNCLKNCQKCNEEDSCLVCKENFLKFKNECNPECPNGFYPDFNIKECFQCDKTCLTCKGPLENDCKTCSENTTLKAGYCKETKEIPENIVINPNNKKEEYFNIADCIDFIFLKYEKLFSLDNEPFIAEIDLKMKENYSKYANDFRFIWDESLLKYNYTLLNNNTKISIDQSNLKLGILEIKVQIFFKNTLIETLKGKSNIIIYKVIIINIL